MVTPNIAIGRHSELLLVNPSGSLLSGTTDPPPPSPRALVNGTVASPSVSVPVAAGETTITVELQEWNSTAGAHQTTTTYKVVVVRQPVDYPDISVRMLGQSTDLAPGATIDLGGLKSGQTSFDLDVRNIGYFADLTGVSMVLLGRDAADFALLTPPSATVAMSAGNVTATIV